MIQSNFNDPSRSLPSGSKVIAYVQRNGDSKWNESIEQLKKTIVDYCEKYGPILTQFYADSASGFGIETGHHFFEMFDTLMTCPEKELPSDLLVFSYVHISNNLSNNIYEYCNFANKLQRRRITIYSMTELSPNDLLIR